jgi:hypothetical protein
VAQPVTYWERRAAGEFERAAAERAAELEAAPVTATVLDETPAPPEPVEHIPIGSWNELYDQMYEWREELIVSGDSPFITGPTGPQGPQGPQGPAGSEGPQGPLGAQGLAGPQGPEGPQGPPGAGITVKGSVQNVGSLPTTGNKAGDAYVVTNTGDLHVWDGAQWIDMGPLQGPQGPQGLQGAAGAQGPQGIAGTAGATGADGAQGPIGPAGPQGPKGDTGPPGTTGAQGPAGPTGADSTVPGPQGAAGPQGVAGAQGPKGDPGQAGSQGPQGATGATGPQGAKGDTGAAGAQGPAGPGVPAGGTTGQQLVKSSSADYATAWATDTGGWTVIRKTADEQVANNTIQDDDHLQFPTVAGTAYELELLAIYACPAGAGTPDLKCELSEDATARGACLWMGLSTTDAAQTLTTTDIGGATATFGTAAAKRIVRGVATHVGNGGQLKFRWAQNTTTAGSPTLVYTGSVLRYRALA